jgi:hypothetical protein
VRSQAGNDVRSPGLSFEPFAPCEDTIALGDFRAQRLAQRCGTRIFRLRGAVAFYKFNLKFGPQQLTAHALRDPQSVNWESPASSLRGFLFSDAGTFRHEHRWVSRCRHDHPKAGRHQTPRARSRGFCFLEDVQPRASLIGSRGHSMG